MSVQFDKIKTNSNNTELISILNGSKKIYDILNTNVGKTKLFEFMFKAIMKYCFSDLIHVIIGVEHADNDSNSYYHFITHNMLYCMQITTYCNDSSEREGAIEIKPITKMPTPLVFDISEAASLQLVKNAFAKYDIDIVFKFVFGNKIRII